MRIKLVHKYLETLKTIYPEIAEKLTEFQDNLGFEVTELKKSEIVFQTKGIILRLYTKLNLPLSYNELELTHHFTDSWGTINTVKLDCWLYNRLLHLGYEIHNMSGLEKLEQYTNKNKKLCYLLK